MTTKATEVMGLIGEAYWMDLFIQLDQTFFRLPADVQSEIWRRVIVQINCGMRDPGELARFTNSLIKSDQIVK